MTRSSALIISTNLKNNIMPIIEPIIRPPAEADSFLLQVTTGCSANTCSFCGAYRHKPFAVKRDDEIRHDIRQHAKRHPATRRVFLMDGDALVVSNEKLIPILKELASAFPLLNRVSSYANGCNVISRSAQELKDLYDHKLTLFYIGLESGNQAILDRCQKRSSVEDMVRAIQQAATVGIKASVIVLLGLGGRRFSKDHVRDTITALNRMQPRYLSFLSVMVIPGTPLHKELRQGTFSELTSIELLQEMYDIIKGLELARTIFRSDHASNYLSLEGRFPQDKVRLLQMIEGALRGNIDLRPEILRGL
jgi:radical SAM superfamily enzyme YgiQ (UPF0313 family)